MPTAHPRIPSQPWRLTQVDQHTADDAAGAVIDLAFALYSAHVRNGTVWELCREAVRQHALDYVPMQVLPALVREAKNEAESARRKVQALQRDNDQADTVNRPLLAVRALVEATFCGFRYDVDQVELDATLSRTIGTSTPVRVTIALASTEREAQRAILRYTGPLASFAERAHPNAKAKDVLRALGDLSTTVDLRVSNDADSQPAQLVGALLSHKIWRTRTEEGQPGRFFVTLRTQPDIYGADGLAIVQENGCPTLYVMPGALVGSIVSPLFRYKSAAEIAKLLRRAPGFIGGTKDGTKYRADVCKAFGTKRAFAINLTAFEAALDASTGEPFADAPQAVSPEDDGRAPIVLSDAEHTARMLEAAPSADARPRDPAPELPFDATSHA